MTDEDVKKLRSWFESDKPDYKKFIDEFTRLMQGELRKISLVTLNEWDKLNIVNTKLFGVLAAFQVPSFGTFNGAIQAISSAVREVLKSGDLKSIENIKSSKWLYKTIKGDYREKCYDSSIISSFLEKINHQFKKNEKLSLEDLFTISIRIRNIMVHDHPVGQSYLRLIASGVYQILNWVEENEFLKEDKLTLLDGSPWVYKKQGESLIFNGIDENYAGIYVDNLGVTEYVEEEAHDLIETFQRLLGKTEEKQKKFKEWLRKLAPEEEKGVLMGDFLVGRPVEGAEGAHGRIHQGVQSSTGRKVAIKILKTAFLDGQEYKARFHQEAKFLSSFNHENIISVINYGEENWVTPRDISLKDESWFGQFEAEGKIKNYIALEWINGKSLEQHYQAKFSDVDIITQWFHDAAKALEVVHNNGNIIHRDIKPSNIMVTEEGVVKLLDFGIARTADEYRTIITEEGNKLGTVAYMSPEQIEVENDYDLVGKATDVYSLCASFYELYTCTRFYNHDDKKVTTRSIDTKKLSGELPTEAQKINKELPRQINDILLGGLQTDIGERYKSIQLLKQDLLHFQRNEPIEYKRQSLFYRVRLFYKRNPVVMNVVLTSLLLIIGITTWYLNNLKIERDRAELAKEKAIEERGRALALVHYMNSSLQDKLESIGRLDIMDDIQIKINKFFDSIEIKSSELDSMREEAVATSQHADTLMGQGEFGLAEKKYKKSHGIFELLVKKYPEDLTWRYDLSVSYIRLGELSIHKGDHEKALSFYHKSLNIRKKLREDKPHNIHAVFTGLAIIYNKIAETHKKIGQHDMALDFYYKGLRMAEEVVNQYPDRIYFKQNMAISHDNIARVYELKNDNNKALKGYRSSLEIYRILVKKDTVDDPRWLDGLAGALINVADIHKVNGEIKKALGHYQEALNIRKKLVMHDSSNTSWQRRLSINQNKLADIFKIEGKTDKALTLYQNSLKIRKGLSKKDPSNMQWQRDLAMIYDKIGSLYEFNGRKKDALEPHNKSSEIREILITLFPENANLKREYSSSLDNIGQILEGQGKYSIALLEYNKSYEIRKNLAKSDPGISLWQHDLSVSLNMIGNIYKKKQKNSLAIGKFKESLEIRKNLAFSSPGNTVWERGVAESFTLVGEAYQANKEIDKALTMYKRSFETYENTLKKNKDDLSLLRKLSVSIDRIAKIYTLKGGDAKALKWYQKLVITQEKMLSESPENMRLQYDLSVTLSNLSNLHYGAGRKNLAIKLTRQSLNISKKLIDKNPGNAMWQQMLMRNYMKLMKLEVNNEKGYLQDALRSLKQLKKDGYLDSEADVLIDRFTKQLKQR